MLFGFDVIQLFGEGVCVLDNRLTPILVEHGSPNGMSKVSSSPRRGRHDFVRLEQMQTVIDRMGEASAKAQGLHSSITGGHRLAQSDHHLYIMVDRKTNQDRGSVVGLLKVGRKTLFVYDRANRQREMVPLCVLDFYVHESRQRAGCGRRLFEAMLRRERVSPEHLAIDRPSHKFSSFLSKHYDLRTVIPQVNHFVVFEGFFVNRPDDGPAPRRVGTSVARPPVCPNRTRPVSHYDRSTRSPYAEHKSNNQVETCRDRPRSRDLNDFSGLHINRTISDPGSDPRLPDVQPIPKPEVTSPDVKSRACASPVVTSERGTARRGVPAITTPEPGPRASEISRPRDGPSPDYRNFLSELNQHQVYQDRRGRLVTNSHTPDRDDVIMVTNHANTPSRPISIPHSRPANQSPITQPRSLPNQQFNSWRDQSPTWKMDQSERFRATDPSDRWRTDQSERLKGEEPSWTVFGTPQNYQGRKWQHTKLW